MVVRQLVHVRLNFSKKKKICFNAGPSGSGFPDQGGRLCSRVRCRSMDFSGRCIVPRINTWDFKSVSINGRPQGPRGPQGVSCPPPSHPPTPHTPTPPPSTSKFFFLWSVSGFWVYMWLFLQLFFNSYRSSCLSNSKKLQIEIEICLTQVSKV